MNIGALKVTLRLPENGSLKDKRRVLKSIIARVRSRFNVSIAEVDNHELWQSAILGITCVSNEGRHVNEVLCKVANYIEGVRDDAEVVDYQIEIIPSL